MVTDRKLAVIIEDDPDVRNLLRTVLTQSGFETVLTSNGEDGVAAVRMHDPILTTLDVSMPGMDGVAAAAAIRAFSDTYIIMITAQDDEIDIISGLNAGADEYLSKPFRPRELRARIASLLRRPRGGATAEAEPVDDGLWRRPSEVPAAPVAAVPPVAAVAPMAPVTPVAPVAPVVPVAPAAPYVPPVAPAPQIPQQAPPVFDAPLAQPLTQTFAQPVTQPISQPVAQPTPQQAAPVQRPVLDSHAAVSPAAARSLATEEGVYVYDGLQLSVASGVVAADGRAVSLDRDEFDLLRTLMSTGRRVRSKADLVLAARGESYVTSYFVTEQDKRQIDRQVASLRRKLNDDREPGRWIETVAGVGYRMSS